MYTEVTLEDYVRLGMEARSKIDCNQIRSLAGKIYQSILNGGKLVTFGNGGSAADAQHFVAELTGHFSMERDPLPAICLNTNVSGLTAISNDYSYDDIFSRQVKALVGSRDVVVGITTSGNSRNVLNGMAEASKLGSYTVAMTGKNGGKVRQLASETLSVQSDDTPIIQEVHIAMIHMLCLEIDRNVTKSGIKGN